MEIKGVFKILSLCLSTFDPQSPVHLSNVTKPYPLGQVGLSMVHLDSSISSNVNML